MIFCTHCGEEVEYPKLCMKCGPICHYCAEKPCPKKRSKMGNVKTKRDEVVFDSGLEAQRYLALKDMQERGEICRLKLQPKFVLQEGFRARNGKWYRAILYKADFEYYLPDGTGPIIEDTKGYKTPKFVEQEKLFRFKWPEIDFRVGDEIYEPR